MSNMIRRFFSILRVVGVDTHLWCISVLAGAVLLCVSFFVEPSQRLIASSDSDKAPASLTVIEYSSVLGSISSIETMEDAEVDKIAEAMPTDFDEYYDLSDEKADENEAELPSVQVNTANAVNEVNAVNAAAPAQTPVTDTVPVAVATPEIDLSMFYSPETIDVLERLVQCEAGSEDMDGRLLVANVVLNRVDTGIWGDDIMSVCMAEGQFDPIGNGAYKTCTVDSVTKKAVINALLGEDISQGAIYFQKSAARVWGNKKFLFRHGHHSFYK